MSLDTIRLFLHLLSAAVWVGGQVVLGSMMPQLRRFDGATKVAAQAFGRVAWPAFAVLVVTGMWSLVVTDSTEFEPSDYVTLFVKIMLAIVSGAAAAAHALSDRKAIMAAGGAIGLLSSLGAFFAGVVLTGAL